MRRCHAVVVIQDANWMIITALSLLLFLGGQ
jgi:hypothetical protein